MCYIVDNDIRSSTTTTTTQRELTVAFPFVIIIPRLEAEIFQEKGLDFFVR
jgi:hypothetical protein